jgi:hypothetical protein
MNFSNSHSNGSGRSGAGRASSRTSSPSSGTGASRSGRAGTDRSSTAGPDRARTIINELRDMEVSSVPAPEHDSTKRMDSDEVEALLKQFVSEKLAHAHLSAQIDNPTRQSIETMAKAWLEPAETIIEAVRRVDRQDPPTSFWEMQA